jgi:hypothetical protein
MVNERKLKISRRRSMTDIRKVTVTSVHTGRASALGTSLQSRERVSITSFETTGRRG